jgi:hypothetical protein
MLVCFILINSIYIGYMYNVFVITVQYALCTNDHLISYALMKHIQHQLFSSDFLIIVIGNSCKLFLEVTQVHVPSTNLSLYTLVIIYCGMTWLVRPYVNFLLVRIIWRQLIHVCTTTRRSMPHFKIKSQIRLLLFRAIPSASSAMP